MRRILLVTMVMVGAACGAVWSAQACPPMPPPDPPPIEPGPRGRLTIRTTPHAAVTVDGRSLGTTPVHAHWIDAGRHRIVLRASCGTFRKTVRVPARQNVTVSWALCPSSSLRPEPSARR